MHIKHPTAHCIGLCCYTTFETLMSATQAINDKLQGSVATYLRCGGVVNNQIKKGIGVWVKKIKIGGYLAKLQARAWLSYTDAILQIQLSQNLTYQKLLKLVNFWPSCSKNNKVDVLEEHRVYVYELCTQLRLTTYCFQRIKDDMRLDVSCTLLAWPTRQLLKTKKVHETITFFLVTLPNIHRFKKNHSQTQQ